MLIDRFESLEAYLASPYVAGAAERLRLEHMMLACGGSGLHAYCWSCARERELEMKPQRFPDGGLAWRETLHCPGCRQSARQRFGLHLLAELMQEGAPPPYLTEQVSYCYLAARSRWPKLIGSEFVPTQVQQHVLSLKLKFLARDPRITVRHEDLTRLTLGDASVGGVLSLDVLEHVPDTTAVLREARRVLVAGAPLVLTAPFLSHSPETQVRATVEPDGSIRHLLEPEYHGDPINSEGALCYYYFGWDLLGGLRSVGFAHAEIVFPWDPHHGYLSGQAAFVGYA